MYKKGIRLPGIWKHKLKFYSRRNIYEGPGRGNRFCPKSINFIRKILGLFADCAAKKEAVAARAKRKSEYLNLFLTGSGIRNQKQYQKTKIRNDRNGNISRRTGSCFEHLNFGFRICFEFRYSNFEFSDASTTLLLRYIDKNCRCGFTKRLNSCQSMTMQLKWNNEIMESWSHGAKLCLKPTRKNQIRKRFIGY